jgi:signal transduction histidine kinase
MKIRTRLTLQFLSIGAAIMLVTSVAIYFSAYKFRKDDFLSRLENKAINVAKLLIEVDEIDVDLLRRIERDNPVNLPSEKIIIYNYRNDILYNTDELRELSITIKDLNLTRLYERIKFRQDGYEILGLLYTEQLDRFVVIAAAIDLDGLSQLRNLRIILLSVITISIFLLFFAGWVYSGRALEPISDVVRQVEEISFTSLNLRVDEGNGTDEIAKLAHTFNRMLERLEEAFKMQKDFISNASHEIRTPLTAIYGQLQVLMLRDRSPDEYKKTIASVLDDIKALSDLSNSLLLLARTRSETTDRSTGKFRIDELLWQAAEELKKVHQDYSVNLDIHFDYDKGEAKEALIRGNEDLLKVAMINIMENACKFSNDMTVEVMLTCSEDIITIVFSDKGIGIPEPELDMIFEPFRRGSNAGSVSGHGIGLSLVRSIIINHTGSIRISSVLGRGTEISVILPV